MSPRSLALHHANGPQRCFHGARLRRSFAQKHRQVRAMVAKESYQLPNGTDAPDFSLPDPRSGKTVTLQDVKGDKATLVMILSNHCPFVIMLKNHIAALVSEYQPKGVGAVGICANSTTTHPQDGPDQMAKDAEEQGYTFPYVHDESQDTAKAYKAMCTPEFYVFDADLKLQYHGRFDSARPSPNQNIPVTGEDLRAALDAVISGSDVPASKPSVGCNVKWHPGNEPDYFG